MPKNPKSNEFPCSRCKEPVSIDASKCPHCQTVYYEAEIKVRKERHASNQKWGLGCLTLVVLLALGMCMSGGKDNTTGSTDDPTEMPAAGSATPNVTAAIVKFNRDIMSAVSGCDSAGKSLAEKVEGLPKGKVSIYDLYPLAAGVEEQCKDSWRRVKDIELPSDMSDGVNIALEKVKDSCETAMLAKQMGGEAMKEVFDGNMKPSAINDAKQKAEAGQAGTLACVAGIFTAAGKAGVDMKALN